MFENDTFGGGTFSGRSSKSNNSVNSGMAAYAKKRRQEEEDSKQVQQLKDNAKAPTTVKINVNGKEVELDEQTKKTWFSMNDQAKKVLKDRLGEDTFNQLKSQLDKEAPKQGIFDKITDKINANSEMDKFKRLQQGQNADYRTAQREAGQKDYTNPLQRVAFSVVEPVARGVNTIAGAAGKGVQGVSDLAGYVAAGTPEEKRIALERMKRSGEDVAFSGRGGLLGVGANFQNAKELEDKKKLAGTAIQTGTDLYSIIPQGKATKLGLAGMSAGKRLGANVAENVVTGLASEGGRQLKEGQFDAKALATGAAMDAALPVGLYGAGRVVRGLSGKDVEPLFGTTAKDAIENLNKAKAQRILDLGRNAPETDRAFLLDAKNPVKEPKTGNLSSIEVPVGKQMSDVEYTKQFDKLSRQYDKLTKEIESGGPLSQKVKIEDLDAYFSQQLETLDNEFLNPTTTQTIQTGFTRPTEAPVQPKVPLSPTAKRIAQIDKINASVQKNGLGSYTPEQLRGLMRERRNLLGQGPSTAAKVKDPNFAQKFFDGGELGYETIAQTGGLGSFADKAVNKAWNSVKNSIVSTKSGKKVFGGIANAFDDQAGILTLTKAAEAKGALREGTTDMIRKKAGDLRRSAAEAQTFVNNLPEGQSLRGAIQDIAQTDFKGDLRASQDSFKDFWSAKSELELENLYNNTGGKSGRLLDPAKKANAEQVIAQFQNPKYTEAFDALAGVYRKVLDDKLASGQITQKTYDSLVDLPYNYSRQQRVLQDWELDNGGNKSGGFGGIQKRDKTDTARELLDPIETMIAYTQRHFADKTMNDYKKQVIGALEAAGEAKRVKMDSTPSGPRESLYIGGEKVEYDVPREVKKAFEAWTPKEIGAIGNLARASNNIFKYGTTGGNVGFIFRNLTVDTISALINSPTPVRMAMEMPVAWAQALGIPTGKVSKALRDITEEQLGNNSTRVAQYHKPGSAKSAGREFVKQDASLKAKGMNIAQNKGEFLQAMKKVDDALGRVEIATRKAQFAALYKKLKKQGYDDASAIQAAGLQAREVTTEFAAGGSLAKTINLASPYFNTKMQVPRTLARNLEKRPVTTALKMATIVGAPMMGLTLWNTETPEKLAIYNDLDERTKEDYFVFIGPNAKKGDDGKWSGITLVRKPNDTSALFEGFRKYIENVANNEPEEHTSWLQILKDTGGALQDNAPVPTTVNQAANALPPLAKTAIEDATNRSIYYGTDLVPEYVKNQSDNPAEQSYKNYSRTSKFLGGLLGKSPITIDNYIRGNLGEVGSQLQNLTDRLTGGRSDRVNSEGQTYSDIGGRSPVESLTRNFDAVRGDEVKRQFWDQVGGKESPVQKAKNKASKKVTDAVRAGDYTRAARLAQEYNDTIAGRVTPFLRKYGNSPQWDPTWDEYLNNLFIKDTPRALRSRLKD